MDAVQRSSQRSAWLAPKVASCRASPRPAGQAPAITPVAPAPDTHCARGCETADPPPAQPRLPGTSRENYP